MENKQKQIIGKAKFVVIVFVLTVFTAFPLSAHAFSAVDGYDCNLTVTVVDGTDGFFRSHFSIGLTNTEDDHPVAFSPLLFEPGGLGKPVTISLQTGLTLRIDYILATSPDFTIVNMDDTPAPTFFETRAGDFSLELKVVYKEMVVSSTESPAPQEVDVFDPDKFSKENAEGYAVLMEFVEATKHISTDPVWLDNGFFNVYVIAPETNAKKYAELSGQDPEIWLNMSDYERFIIFETYISLYILATSGSNERYFGSVDNFISNTCFSCLNMMKSMGTFGNIDTTAEQEAYKKLMLWEYEYILENGLPYNFITGTYDTSMKEEQESSGVFLDLPNESLENATDEELLGISQKTKTNPILPIIIIVIIAAAVGIFFYFYRKKKLSSSR